MKKKISIFCPKCEERPGILDEWVCTCGCVWNTFETCGVCPDCGKVWEFTACYNCGQWSLHSAWYHEYSPDNVEEHKMVKFWAHKNN